MSGWRARSAVTTARQSRGLRATHSAPAEAGDDVSGDGFQVSGLLGEIADGVHDEVVHPGGPEPLELFGALFGRADDAVFLGKGPEVLGVALGEQPYPRGPRALVVASHRDEGEVGGREALERSALGVSGRADLVEALRVPLGLHHIGHPALALATR